MNPTKPSNHFFKEISMRTPSIRTCVAVMAIPFCSMAYAHPGHGIGFMEGMASWQFGVGLLLTTVALHGLGMALGGRLYKQALRLRVAGALVAASGALLVAANW